jgi:hypothetical protein
LTRQVVSKYKNIRYYESEERLDCWGHQNRAFGLEKALGGFVSFQNADNEVLPGAFKEMLSKAKETSSDVILSDLKHSYFSYMVLVSHFAINYCDMCNFIIRADLAREAGFFPKGDKWDKTTDFAADGHFIERVKTTKKDLLVTKIPKVFFIHH